MSTDLPEKSWSKKKKRFLQLIERIKLAKYYVQNYFFTFLMRGKILVFLYEKQVGEITANVGKDRVLQKVQHISIISYAVFKDSSLLPR